MTYTEESKKGLRHNQAEPEDYLWLSDGETLYKTPKSGVDANLTAEQKFLAAKNLFDSGDKDTYQIKFNQ